MTAAAAKAAVAASHDVWRAHKLCMHVVASVKRDGPLQVPSGMFRAQQVNHKLDQLHAAYVSRVTAYLLDFVDDSERETRAALATHLGPAGPEDEEDEHLPTDIPDAPNTEKTPQDPALASRVKRAESRASLATTKALVDRAVDAALEPAAKGPVSLDAYRFQRMFAVMSIRDRIVIRERWQRSPATNVTTIGKMLGGASYQLVRHIEAEVLDRMLMGASGGSYLERCQAVRRFVQQLPMLQDAEEAEAAFDDRRFDEMLGKLGSRERIIVRELWQKQPALTLREVGIMIGVGKKRVTQLQTDVLRGFQVCSSASTEPERTARIYRAARERLWLLDTPRPEKRSPPPFLVAPPAPRQKAAR